LNARPLIARASRICGIAAAVVGTGVGATVAVGDGVGDGVDVGLAVADAGRGEDDGEAGTEDTDGDTIVGDGAATGVEHAQANARAAASASRRDRIAVIPSKRTTMLRGTWRRLHASRLVECGPQARNDGIRMAGHRWAWGRQDDRECCARVPP
jgi:hypothetical protein